jgi:uncharacterized protein (DUF4415 family)
MRRASETEGSLKRTVGKKRYVASDMRAVSDNPEWTRNDSAKTKPFGEVFPKMRKGRGPNKAPTKELVSSRLSPAVLEHFKGGGPGWQTRIDEALAKIVKRKPS